MVWQLFYGLGCLMVLSHGQYMTEEFKEKHSIDKYRVILNDETRDLVPTIKNSQDSICYKVYPIQIKYANVHAVGCDQEACIGIF